MRRFYVGSGVDENFGRVILQKTTRDYLKVTYYGDVLTFESNFNGNESITAVKSVDFMNWVRQIVTGDSKDDTQFVFSITEQGDLFDHSAGTLRKIYNEVMKLTSRKYSLYDAGSIVYYPLSGTADLYAKDKKVGTFPKKKVIAFVNAIFRLDDSKSTMRSYDDDTYVYKFTYTYGDEDAVLTRRRKKSTSLNNVTYKISREFIVHAAGFILYNDDLEKQIYDMYNYGGEPFIDIAVKKYKEGRFIEE